MKCNQGRLIEKHGEELGDVGFRVQEILEGGEENQLQIFLCGKKR